MSPPWGDVRLWWRTPKSLRWRYCTSRLHFRDVCQVNGLGPGAELLDRLRKLGTRGIFLFIWGSAPDPISLPISVYNRGHLCEGHAPQWACDCVKRVRVRLPKQHPSPLLRVKHVASAAGENLDLEASK